MCDWSSDVCSSALSGSFALLRHRKAPDHLVEGAPAFGLANHHARIAGQHFLGEVEFCGRELDAEMGGDLGGAFPLGVEIAHGCQPIMKWRREKPSEERGLRLRPRRQLAAPPEIVRMFDRESVRGWRGPELDGDAVLYRSSEERRFGTELCCT